MFNPVWIPVLVALNVAYCGATSGNIERRDDPFAFTCWEHSLMLNVEADVLSSCTANADCGQVLNGTGVGCATDDRIANNAANVSPFYDMLEEAEDAGCSIDFGTTGECDPTARPVCIFEQCGWD